MTIAQIINIWPIAQYLAANEIQNRRNNSGAVDVNLPTKIYSMDAFAEYQVKKVAYLQSTGETAIK